MFTLSLLRRLRTGSTVALTALLLVCTVALHAQRVVVAARSVDLTALAASDAGAVPTSQPIEITLRMAPSADRVAALDTLLAEQVKTTSSSYHQWLTPAQFATSYGATSDQISALSAWVQAQGLTVTALSPAGTRMTVLGSAGQVQRAFGVTLRNYFVGGTDLFANTSQPTVPAVVAPLIAGISGLSNLPLTHAMTVQPVGSGQSKVLAELAPGAGTSAAISDDPLSDAATAVDANGSALLAISTAACSTDFAQADYDAYTALFKQANAQGITVMATSGCGADGTGSFPASLAQVTALVVDPATAAFVAIAARPDWQVAAGLPDDAYRHEPDLETSSLAAFSQTMTTILAKTGSRQGNINSTLYSLATTPDLYTQADGAAPGTWEASTGLGLVDLATLVKVFPNATGTFATTTSLTASVYTLTYGAPLTLTGKVLAPVYTNANPTGTVTFSGATQGVLGSASVDSTGTALLTLSTGLNVGTYSVTATYSGDANYAASSNATPAIITVTIANGVVTASISPTANVPYGSTATVTATVTLPSSSAAPSGAVTASIEGIAGAVYSNTLTPNPGGNSGTTNIVIAAPPPNSVGYDVQVTCAGNQNFQCQSPANPTFTTVKGNATVTVSVSPAVPQAGSPVTLTAVISNAGNGTGTYTFTGNVMMYDNGKLVATGAVGSNQTTAVVTLSGGVTHSIVATYSGDGDWNSSSSPAASVTPTLLPSAMTLSSNVASALAGVNVVLTATVFTTASNSVGPTGVITFYDTFNGSLVTLGAATLTPNGPNESIAVFSTTGLLAGTHSVFAIYGGDSNFTTVTSSTLSLTMKDYTVTMVPQTLTLNAGQNGQVVMLLGLVGGFNGTVSFGCTPPAGTETTCSFSPVSLTGGGTTTMSILTTAPVISTSVRKGTGQGISKLGGWGAGAGSALAALLCFALPRRRRSIPMLLCGLLALSLSASMGCGSGLAKTSGTGGGTVTDPGSPLGTTTFTITSAGTDGVNTVRHTYQYQVTIQ